MWPTSKVSTLRPAVSLIYLPENTEIKNGVQTENRHRLANQVVISGFPYLFT